MERTKVSHNMDRPKWFRVRYKSISTTYRPRFYYSIQSIIRQRKTKTRRAIIFGETRYLFNTESKTITITNASRASIHITNDYDCSRTSSHAITNAINYYELAHLYGWIF